MLNPVAKSEGSMASPLRKWLRQLLAVGYSASVTFGFDPLALLRAVRGLPGFIRDAANYRRGSSGGRFPLRIQSVRPRLAERFSGAGSASGHYFHQDLWAARKVYQARPLRHLDVGSRVDGFVAHLLTFMAVDVLDVRPLASNVEGLRFAQEDATHLSGIESNSVSSLSSLHAIEHFGLGRYGDTVDASACFTAMRNLARVLQPGGRLYFSVPVGIERVEFNAHRIFAPSTILNEFRDLRLLSFSAVDDAGDLHAIANPEHFESSNYACGMYEFTKE